MVLMKSNYPPPRNDGVMIGNTHVLRACSFLSSKAAESHADRKGATTHIRQLHTLCSIMCAGMYTPVLSLNVSSVLATSTPS